MTLINKLIQNGFQEVEQHPKIRSAQAAIVVNRQIVQGFMQQQEVAQIRVDEFQGKYQVILVAGEKHAASGELEEQDCLLKIQQFFTIWQNQNS